jgi:hypothetical protein
VFASENTIMLKTCIALGALALPAIASCTTVRESPAERVSTEGAVAAQAAEEPLDPETRALALDLLRLEREAPEPTVRRPGQEDRSHLPAVIDAAERAPSSYSDARVVLRTRGPEGSEEHRELVRSGDRLHLALGDASQAPSVEWLFVRNALDPAQYSGWLVAHDIQHSIQYDWMSLVSGGIANSWMRLACMGVRPGDLEPLLATAGDAPRREAFGLSFVKLQPHDGLGPADVGEVWWNAEHAVALEVRGGPAHAQWVQELVALELAADEEVLRAVEERFPDYRVSDLADFQDAAHVHPSTATADHAHEGAPAREALGSRKQR